MALPEETKRRGSWVPTRRKPECPLEISIDKHFEAKIYTSGSIVAGTVSIMPQTNLTFDTFEITFTGAASTLVEMFHQGTMPKEVSSCQSNAVSPGTATPAHCPRKCSVHAIQEKSIRKDILSSKLGYIRASARQPKPVVISANKLQPSNCQLSVDLEFWPTSKKAAPPEICGKSAAIKASTYYSTGHISFLPDQHNNPSVTPNPILSFVLDENATVNQALMLVWEPVSVSSSV
ncbi:hypothetical protein FOXG_21668 [Fusarium oxysporum f. sp. lycopersici 4287]|uniref:Uncharacterized protein n=1 Tax=Fusarium oxysporum f. sp. lycopersici (strain 4287 / CBS 123668 / FGSC 9935 / NRRL 34936) TaxID=426428 RepID=A0A0J9W082_FUSO4|nr:hypothetical protein FOXG_21668 [Fusarium oxysporum f. sp. lycopersici 4287]KNB16426.1 hypothetical protein FOXG_21668 [Fusarium oxysporum f. sp. lycopersici 4287]